MSLVLLHKYFFRCSLRTGGSQAGIIICGRLKNVCRKGRLDNSRTGFRLERSLDNLQNWIVLLLLFCYVVVIS